MFHLYVMYYFISYMFLSVSLQARAEDAIFSQQYLPLGTPCVFLCTAETPLADFTNSIQLFTLGEYSHLARRAHDAAASSGCATETIAHHSTHLSAGLVPVCSATAINDSVAPTTPAAAAATAQPDSP